MLELAKPTPNIRKEPKSNPRTTAVSSFEREFAAAWLGVICTDSLPKKFQPVDSRGDIYVGEVAYTNWPNSHGDTPKPDHIRTLQKLERVI